jgi:hypothetical protein
MVDYRLDEVRIISLVEINCPIVYIVDRLLCVVQLPKVYIVVPVNSRKVNVAK